MYKHVVRPLLFLFDPEWIHDATLTLGETLGKIGLARTSFRFLCNYHDNSLSSTILGITFRNPIGLGAGFDKNGRLTNILPSLSFGFMEIGSITNHQSNGNPGAHLVRLPKDQGLIVYYGLKNDGASTIMDRMKTAHFDFPVGVNIAKTNRADISGSASIDDLVQCYKKIAGNFSYITINISCPNSQDGCSFQDPLILETLLQALSREHKRYPVFLKISSHLTTEQIDAILRVVGQHTFVDGFIVGNLSKNREALRLDSDKETLNLLPKGGISGKPIRDITTEMIRYLYRSTKGRYVIIGIGGAFTAEDVYEKIKAGASLVQIVTGLIYGGPFAPKKINKGLVKLLKQDGYTHISQAIGSAKN